MNKNNYHKPATETMKSILAARLTLAAQLITEDIENELIRTEDTVSFDSLHQATDPNCYICDDSEPVTTMEKEQFFSYGVEDWIEYWQILIDILDT